jgi:hypothetical protein
MFQTKRPALFTAASVNHLRDVYSNTSHVGEEFRSTICSPGWEFATLVKNLIAGVVIAAAFVGIAVEATTPNPHTSAEQVPGKLRKRLDSVAAARHREAESQCPDQTERSGLK